MAKLIVNPTSSSRREIPLPRTLLSVGRDPSNDLVLPDAMVSRRHAVIELRGSQYYLRDCNSSNGSLVNGDRVSERSLRDGDLVAIGTARLLFRDDPDVEEVGSKVVQHPSSARLQCPNCNADYRKGDVFCRQCGAQVAPHVPPRVLCTACGTAVPMPARFCNACGTPLAKDAARGGRPGSEDDAASEAAGAVASREADEPAGSATGAADAMGKAVEPLVAALGSALPAEAPRPAPPPAAMPEPPRPAPAAVEPPRVPEPAPPPAPAAEPDRPPEGRAAEAEPAPAGPARRPTPAPRLTPAERSPARSDGAWRPSEARVVERAHRSAAVSAPADVGRRVVAAAVDAALVAVGLLVLVAPLLFYWGAQQWPPDVGFLPILVSVIVFLVALTLCGGYYVYFWGVRGATPGKALFDLAVEGTDGVFPVGPGRAVVRLLGCVIAGLPLGLGLLFGLHDRIAGTRVTRRERA
ncbi:MAG: FHA domain-containing protein [Acidobacteria bacterium]|nr:FHA domain-containing protein [Acidobacteriota bacterium]